MRRMVRRREKAMTEHINQTPEQKARDLLNAWDPDVLEARTEDLAQQLPPQERTSAAEEECRRKAGRS